MIIKIVHSLEPVLLLGGGAVDRRSLRAVARMAPRCVAADGGAAHALAAGIQPEAVIGDMDSLDPVSRSRIPPGRLHEIAEQETTDFDKALRAIAAPLVLGMGFLDGRVDHALGALNVLSRYPHRACVLIGRQNALAHLPPDLALPLAPGTPVSLFPMRAVSGVSQGLRWPIDGLRFAPDGQSGTSNRAEGPIRLCMDHPGMLVILPRAQWRMLARAVQDAPSWPAPCA